MHAREANDSGAATCCDDTEYLEFLTEARREVLTHMDIACGMLEATRLGIGRWHPNGFAAFDVAMVEGVGLIRLHFWPKGLRRNVSRHPPIHNHSFHLYSKVLLGAYRESRYEVGDASDTRSHSAPLRQYLVVPARNDGVDRLDVGGWVGVRSITSRLSFEARTWHGLPAGWYHSTPIPISTLCATMVMLGVPYEGIGTVLVGREGFDIEQRCRPIVEGAELEVIYEQFGSVRIT